MADPKIVAQLLADAYQINKDIPNQAAIRDKVAAALDAGVEYRDLLGLVARSKDVFAATKAADYAATAAKANASVHSNSQTLPSGKRLEPSATGYRVVNNDGKPDVPVAPAAPAPGGANGKKGHYESSGLGDKVYYVDADGNIALDNNGAPVLFSPNGSSTSGGGDTGVSASIAAAQSAADREERAREFEATYKRGIEEFDKKFARDSFVSDREWQTQREQYGKSFAENQRQFNVGEQNKLSVAGAQETGTNARFGAQYDLDSATAANNYGLTAANNENQYGLSEWQAENQDQLARYGAETSRQSRLSELALQREAQAREILNKPSDALTRLFFQRGGNSPSPFVSQADLLDRLGAQIDAATPAPVPVGAPRPAYKAPPAYLTPKPFVPPQSILSPANAGGAPPPAVQPSSPNPGLSAYAGTAAALGIPLAAEGGMIQNSRLSPNMVMTGDSKPGEAGKENEELVIDLPNDGGLMVIPKDRLVGKRKVQAKSIPHAAVGGYFGDTGTGTQAGAFATYLAGADAARNSGNPGGADRTLYQLTHGGALPSAGGAGTGGGGLTPMPKQTQEQLVSTARDATAPGGQSYLSGAAPADLRFTDYQGNQQALGTYQSFNRLTAGEKENLQPRLAAEYNMGLQDLIDQLNARYQGSRIGSQARLTIR